MRGRAARAANETRWGILALALSGCVPSFSGFSIVDDAGQDAGVDANVALDAGTIDAGVDGGMFVQTVLDVVCPEVWDQFPGSPPGAACVGREVTAITPAIISEAVSITRSPSGRVLIAYNDLEFVDSGALIFLAFLEDDAAAAEEVARLDGGLGEVQGVDVQLASSAPDIEHVVYWYRSESGHEVRYRTLRDTIFTPVEAVDSTVGRNGVVDIAIDSVGDPIVVFHDDTSGNNAACRRTDGSFDTPVRLRTDVFPEMDGFGSVGVATGPSGTVHVAYQWGVTLTSSSPSYNFGTLASWTSPHTLDNRAFAVNRFSGVGVDVAIVGDTRTVVYLDWQSGAGELRMARFETNAADPVVTNYRSGMTIDDPPWIFPLELEVDPQGMLHLLFVDVGPFLSTLAYHRETLVGGERRWLVDRVAEFSGPHIDVPLDMVIGPDRRPHIVYQDPETGAIHYATARPLPL